MLKLPAQMKYENAAKGSRGYDETAVFSIIFINFIFTACG